MSSGADAGANGGNLSLYLGLAIGVGGLLVIGIIAIIIRLFQRRRQFRHAQSLEHGIQADLQHSVAETSQVPRASILGINDHKWEALSSKEDVTEQIQPSRKSIIPAFHLPKRMKKHGIALRRLKHLSAIVESPRSQNAATLPALQEEKLSPGVPKVPSWPLPVPPDVFSAVPEMSSTEALFAPDRSRAPRSVSVNALLEPQRGLKRSLSGSVAIKTHVRSVSLGAEPPARLPPDPTPQTVILPMGQDNPHDLLRRLSKESYDSEASAGSSVLVNSPFLTRRKTPRFLTDRPSALRPHKSANKIIVVQSRHDPDSHTVDRMDSRVSLLSDEEKASRGYLVSSSSVSSLDDDGVQRSQSLSTFRFPSRPIASPRSVKSRRDKSTIRRVSRFSISADGSPSGRRRSGVLQDICGNAMPSREHSNASQRSTNSSDGNPFQWDGVPLKPSAMKGSPNARKGHRRQNCVRISTLTPQVLGPPPSRPDSPSITHGIQEETNETSPGLTFVTNKRPPRPSSVGPNNSLRVKTLRASLTPSSPTLSLWATYSDYRLQSQPSDSHLTVSSGGRLSRPASGISSIYSIPQFPSPSTVTVSQVQHDRPVPEFCVSSPADVDSSSSPFALQSECSPRKAWQESTRKRAREPSPSDGPRIQWSSRPPSTVSLSSFDAAKGGGERPSSPPSPSRSPDLYRSASPTYKLTSENASSSLDHLQNPVFPGAPVLPPPLNETWQPPPPANHHRRCSRGSPSGPRIEPAKSVSKIAMELRRMNSEIDTSLSRESRRYLRFDREASPVLPLFDSPNPSESCTSLFDFGFDEPRRSHDAAIVEHDIVSAVQTVKCDSPSLVNSTPMQSSFRNKLLKRDHLGKPGTPNSLYDAAGFYKEP